MSMRLNKLAALAFGCSAAMVPLTATLASDDAQGASGRHGDLLGQQSTLALGASDLAGFLGASPAGQQLLQISGVPACDIEIVHYRYRTLGGAGEPATASGALMIPSGGAACSGPRPTLLYAHGTSTYRHYNIADITQTDPGNGDGAIEGISLAAMYAAQGYIVVASNYAGYAGSDLSYHPYLNGDQQAGDVVDSLTAARLALSKAASGAVTSGNGKLFITGYSQGGYVALATHRALQAAGVPVTASSPASGPYALAAMADAIFAGDVDLGGTVFTTLIASSYQHAYGNIYQRVQDIVEPAYARGFDTLLPSTLPMDALFTTGKLPLTSLFSATPPAPLFASLTPPLSSPLTPPELTLLFSLGFGTDNLVRNSYRLGLLKDALAHPDGAFPATTHAMAPAISPAHSLRQAFKRNDLRNWVPTAPVLLCGGHDDPTVFYFNANVQQAYWRAAHVTPGLTTTLDVDSAPGRHDPYAPLKQGFAQAKTAVALQAIAAGATDGGMSAVLQTYHDTLVPPFCLAAARGFFSSF